MAKATLLLFLFCLPIISEYNACFGALDLATRNEQQQKTWCVAKPASDLNVLMRNINYTCQQVGCSIIQKGSPCYYPDSYINHASVAMNFYYYSKGRNAWNCDFGNSGLIVVTDPSYGSCKYE